MDVRLTTLMSASVLVTIDLTGIFDWDASDLTGEVPLTASMSVVMVLTWNGTAGVLIGL